MTGPAAVGVIAEFDRAEDMVRALRAARSAGWRSLDAYAPYPVPEAAELLGAHGAAVGWIAVAAGAVGAALAFATEVWLNAFEYPLNVGGRPLFSWPLFLPAAMVVGTLWGAAAALVGMLALNGLPRLHYPVFAAPGVERATEDRFFLCLFADDPLFEAAAAGLLGRCSGFSSPGARLGPQGHDRHGLRPSLATRMGYCPPCPHHGGRLTTSRTGHSRHRPRQRCLRRQRTAVPGIRPDPRRIDQHPPIRPRRDSTPRRNSPR